MHWWQDSVGSQAASLAMHGKLGIDQVNHNFLQSISTIHHHRRPATDTILSDKYTMRRRQAYPAGLLLQCYGRLMHVFYLILSNRT